jgi:hypothetical protein
MAVGALVFGSGCVERYMLFVDLHDSHLVTPNGPVPYEMADARRNPGFQSNPNLMATAHAPEFEVIVGLFPGVQQVFIRRMKRAHTIDAEAGRSWYRLNDEPETPLSLTRADPVVGPSQSAVTLDFDLPAPLSEYDIIVYGNTLREGQVEQIRAREDDTHHLYLSFTADDQPYAVNSTFSVGVRTSKALRMGPTTP